MVKGGGARVKEEEREEAADRLGLIFEGVERVLSSCELIDVLDGSLERVVGR